MSVTDTDRAATCTGRVLTDTATVVLGDRLGPRTAPAAARPAFPGGVHRELPGALPRHHGGAGFAQVRRVPMDNPSHSRHQLRRAS